VTRWQQVWELWLEGWSVPEIARRLEISDGQAWTALGTAQAYAAGERMQHPRIRRALKMAAVYPDRNRRNWILWQMGVEERER
jgi:hypothetical protein